MDDAAVGGPLGPAAEGVDHADRRLDPVALLEPELRGAVETAVALRCAQQDSGDREQVRDLAHVDLASVQRRLRDGRTASVDRNRCAGEAEYVDDPLVALGILRIHAGDRAGPAERTRHEGEGGR